MPSFCPICNQTVDDIDVHIEESHSDPDKLRDGKSEADFIRMVLEAGDTATREVPVDVGGAVAIPGFDVLGDIGVKLADVARVTVTTETGSSLTGPEAKLMFVAVEELTTWRIDRASFIVNMLDWGIRNGFTEEHSEAGGFVIVSDPTTPLKEQFFKVETLAAHISEAFSRHSGRSFTFRRLGRFLGPKIPAIVAQNEHLNRYFTEGSPMGNRLGIAPSLFLTATSIFEHIKPFQKWSSDEKKLGPLITVLWLKCPTHKTRALCPQICVRRRFRLLLSLRLVGMISVNVMALPLPIHLTVSELTCTPRWGLSLVLGLLILLLSVVSNKENSGVPLVSGSFESVQKQMSLVKVETDQL